MSASFRSEVDTCKWASAVGREEEALAKRRGGTQMKGSEANGPFAVAGAQPYEARARPQHKLSHSNLKFPLAAERQETMALSIFVPIGYVATLVVSMLVFSRIYRRRSALNLAKSYQPWFPEGHEARDIYQTLVAADPPAPEEVLKAALLNRAMTDVRRIMRMRDDKQALGTLLQKGSIGDETMARFTLAEKELEAEILDVVSEANTFREGWGQLIFPSASEMVAHLKHKEIYYEIQRQRAAEVKKLEDEGKPVPKANVELPPLITPPGTKIEIPGGPGGPGGPMPAPPQGGPGPNGPGISLPMTGSGQDARVTLPNGMQLHPAQLQALMQGPLPPNMPPQQAAMLMEARAQLLALQEQAQAQAQAQAQQQQQQQQPADANKENDQTPAAAPTEAKAETPAAPSTKTATVEDGDDA